MKDSIYWGTHLAKHAPALLIDCTVLAITARSSRDKPQFQILIGTHHKVLTVFLGRVMRAFAAVAGRTVSRGRRTELDYRADLLLDHHSEFDFTRIERNFVGIHVNRDPRDLLVSCAFYHQHANESWLHLPRAEFNGMTYQQKIISLDSMEERLLFELDHSAGDNITTMLNWKSVAPQITELRYDELVGNYATENFCKSICDWPLSYRERRVLRGLFRYFSIDGPGASGNSHIRNPRSGQWQEHFTDRVLHEFDRRFPDAAQKLGYE